MHWQCFWWWEHAVTKIPPYLFMTWWECAGRPINFDRCSQDDCHHRHHYCGVNDSSASVSSSPGKQGLFHSSSVPPLAPPGRALLIVSKNLDRYARCIFMTVMVWLWPWKCLPWKEWNNFWTFPASTLLVKYTLHLSIKWTIIIMILAQSLQEELMWLHIILLINHMTIIMIINND